MFSLEVLKIGQKRLPIDSRFSAILSLQSASDENYVENFSIGFSFITSYRYMWPKNLISENFVPVNLPIWLKNSQI